MMKMKRIVAVGILCLSSFLMSGCWNSREVNSLGFMMAMGLDKTENGILLSVQVLNSRAIASQKTVIESPTVVYTQEGTDVFELIRKMVTQSPRRINGTHLQTVIFGEEFARDGVSSILEFLSREHQIRTDVYFVMAKGSTANSLLTSITKYESNSSVKLTSCIKNAEKVWAGTKSIKTLELINLIISDGNNPVLTGAAIVEKGKEENTIDSLKETQADPIKLKDLAVFKKDRFIGWLNEDESKGYDYIIDKVTGTIGYVEDPSIGKITLEVTHTKSKMKANMINEMPAMTVTIEITANIAGVEGNLDITKEENLQKVAALGAEKTKNVCYKALRKAQVEFGSDVFGFGEVIHRTYPKLWKTWKVNWNDHFKSLPVTVNVNVTIEGTGTISKSFFMEESK